MEKQKLERIVASLRRQRKQLATRMNLYVMFTTPTVGNNKFLRRLTETFMCKCVQYRKCKQLLKEGEIESARNIVYLARNGLLPEHLKKYALNKKAYKTMQGAMNAAVKKTQIKRTVEIKMGGN